MSVGRWRQPVVDVYRFTKTTDGTVHLVGEAGVNDEEPPSPESGKAVRQQGDDV